jgi:SAM-dependent methyltransferase
MGNLDRPPVGARVDAYMTNPDVPSPIDLRLKSDACEWEKTAFEKRPWRTEFFARFADQLMLRQPPVRCVLELGSGPGFLASHLLSELPDLHMVLLDFSEAMHELARRRVGPIVNRVEFLSKNFKNSDWVRGLKEFDDATTTIRYQRSSKSSLFLATLFLTVAKDRMGSRRAGGRG